MKYFKLSEFDSPDVPGSGSRMKPEFLKMIDRARDIAGGELFVINSGYRTVAHNTKVGGTVTSSHLTGCAADIAVRNSSQRFRIVAALIAVGFTRIGIADTFIHCDIDTTKTPGVAWLYA